MPKLYVAESDRKAGIVPDGQFHYTLAPDLAKVRGSSFRMRSWLWWNLLSLDAPTVALARALLFAAAVNLRLPLVGATVLLACIWLIYVLDRVLDGWRGDPAELWTARHRFYRRHWRIMLACASAVFSVALWLTLTRMARAVLHAGLAVLAAAGVYLLTVHALPSARRCCPKEVMTGLIFSFGSALPLWARMPGPRLRLVAPVLLFGVLCWLNCTAIECWENHRAGRSWRRPPTPWMTWIDGRLRQSCLSLMLLALLLAVSP